jgi:phospholipase C
VPAGTSRTVQVSIGAGLGAGAYNLTVIGPNRFRRDFKGNSTTAGAALSSAVTVSEDASAPSSGLVLALVNSGSAAATFTITANHYATYSATQAVTAGTTWSADLTAALTASGWYDFTVTASTDSSWSRRYTGHLENGLPSVTG